MSFLNMLLGDDNEHFQLSDILINKGWYPTQNEPIEQLKEGYEKS
jgi:hypothetical protein